MSDDYRTRALHAERQVEYLLRDVSRLDAENTRLSAEIERLRSASDLQTRGTMLNGITRHSPVTGKRKWDGSR